MIARIPLLAMATVLLACPVVALEMLAFRSPTGNIHCMILSNGWAEARCDLMEAVETYPRPPDCDMEWGRSFAVGPAGPGQPLCVGDTVAMSGTPVLNYGGSISHAGFTCRSERTGMTCVNLQGHGFALARARQVVF